VNTIGKKEEPGKKRHTPHDSLEKQPITYNQTKTKHTNQTHKLTKENQKRKCEVKSFLFGFNGRDGKNGL
jgi:hypothetical protein